LHENELNDHSIVVLGWFSSPSNYSLRRLGFSNPSHWWQKGTYFA